MAIHFPDPVTISGGLTVTGKTVLAGATELPAGTVSNSAIANSAEISATKLQHRFSVPYSQAEGTDVVTDSKVVHLVSSNGSLKSVKIRVTDPPTVDKELSIEIEKTADGSGTWASLLSAPVVIDDTAVANTTIEATLIGNPALLENDAIRITVTASGASGDQVQGLLVQLIVDESGIL